MNTNYSVMQFSQLRVLEKKIYVILFANFPVIPASIVYGISRIFRMFSCRLWKTSSGMSHKCASTAIRIPVTFAQPSISPPEQIPAQERGEVTVSFGATLACSPQEQNTKTDSTRARKEISTFEPRRPELSFGISRRWDVAAPEEGSLREDRPASLSAASVLHFLVRLRSLFFVLANFDDFSRQSSVIVILQSSGSFLWSI